jgi:hypothetical protein
MQLSIDLKITIRKEPICTGYKPLPEDYAHKFYIEYTVLISNTHIRRILHERPRDFHNYDT